MEAHEAELPGQGPPSESLPTGPPTIPETSPVRVPNPAPSWRLVALGALAIGLASWGLGESSLVKGKASATEYNLMGMTIQGQTAETIRAANRATAFRFFAICGGLLSLAMTLAARFAPGLSPAPRVASLLIPILCAGACGLAAWCVMPLYDRAMENGSAEMASSILAHLGLWVPVGASAGLALGLARGRVVPVLAGALGAVLGVLAFEFLGALAFPLAETGKPISGTSSTRLLACLMIIIPAALLAAGSLPGEGALARPPSPRD